MSVPVFINKIRADFRLQGNKFLDKYGKKWPLNLIISLVILVKRGKFVYVFFEQGVWIHKCKDGIIVDRKINYGGTLKYYEKIAEDNWLSAYKPKPGDIIFDIGSGKGEETYCFSKLVTPNGRVFSIEAHPQTFFCLSKFCEYNKLKNVTPLNLAVYDKESEVMIDNPDSDILSTVVNSAKGFKVKSVSLDSVVAKFGIDSIDFIKMNIEGAEIKALYGMTNCIKKTKHVCIACHDFIADKGGNEQMITKNEVVNFLRQNNFQIILREDDNRPWIRDQINGVKIVSGVAGGKI